MIKLRGHHLICLQFFEGKGYSREFVENMRKIYERLKKGEKVKITEGKDDICSKCPNLKENKCFLEEKVEKKDKKVLKLFGLSSEEEIYWDEVVKIFQSFSKKDLINICKDCLWIDICLK